MKERKMEFANLEYFAQQDAGLKWYAIADSAQNSELPNILLNPTCLVRCLFGKPQGSLVAQYSPHLVELDSPRHRNEAWSWISLNVRMTSCVSIIATKLSFDELFSRLTQCIDVSLPDEESMFLAIWDPAILGTLIGQEDDDTLYVKGPVLDQNQRMILMQGINRWVYWNRNGACHTIYGSNVFEEDIASRIILNQGQVDALVEASVPDHILHYLSRNQSSLMDEIPFDRRYKFAVEALTRARDIGLKTMRDIINYVCAELFYKERMQKEESIIYLMSEVRNKNIAMDNAIRELP